MTTENEKVQVIHEAIKKALEKIEKQDRDLGEIWSKIENLEAEIEKQNEELRQLLDEIMNHYEP